MDSNKFFWLLRNPRNLARGISARVRYLKYPWYETYVGPPDRYEELGRYQFDLLKSWGLEPHSSLLDIGCGSLRAGRFIIRYLNSDNYCGIEPNARLLKKGIGRNLEKEVVREKRPRFSHDPQFSLSVFDRTFDFLLAHSIFTHAAQHQIKKCFVEASRVMTPASLFFANYNPGKTDYAEKDWVYPGHVTYTFACISKLAQEAGLTCLELNVEHPTLATWTVACGPKAVNQLSKLVARSSQSVSRI